jgi:DNA-binding NtrC family response regulator
MLSILLVDDEPSVRGVMADLLRDEGYRVATAADGAEAFALLDEQRFDLVVADVRMPKADGFAILTRLRRELPATDVILMSAYGSIAEAVTAMKGHALDYLPKPVQVEQLLDTVARVAAGRRLQAERARARAEMDAARGSLLLGASPPIERMRQRIDAVAASDASVLLVGEPGSGKDLVARLIHERSARAAGRLVVVRCAGATARALTEELFGRAGRLPAAAGGTLFLDAIDDMPLEVQGRLLRVLESAADAAVPADARLVSATVRDLAALVEEGRFLGPLYRRLRVLQVEVPPLRDRRSDLPLLVERHLRRFANDEVAAAISPRAWAALNHYAFPGNVRELQQVLEHALVLGGGRDIEFEHLPEEVRAGGDGAVSSSPPVPSDPSLPRALRPLSIAVEEFEREYLLRALALANGERTRAAAMLGISRKCLWQKLRKNGVRRASSARP